MPRTKGGVKSRRRHNRVLAMTKGQRMTRNNLFGRAKQAQLKSLFYMTRDRGDRKRMMRRLWIVRINAAARQFGLSYSRLMDGLNKLGVVIDRKMLAEMAVHDIAGFETLAKAVKA